jgi:hypothetical protein
MLQQFSMERLINANETSTDKESIYEYHVSALVIRFDFTICD